MRANSKVKVLRIMVATMPEPCPLGSPNSAEWGAVERGSGRGRSRGRGKRNAALKYAKFSAETFPRKHTAGKTKTVKMTSRKAMQRLRRHHDVGKPM